jgi:hypothetical protein
VSLFSRGLFHIQTEKIGLDLFFIHSFTPLYRDLYTLPPTTPPLYPLYTMDIDDFDNIFIILLAYKRRQERQER